MKFASGLSPPPPGRRNPARQQLENQPAGPSQLGPPPPPSWANVHSCAAKKYIDREKQRTLLIYFHTAFKKFPVFLMGILSLLVMSGLSPQQIGPITPDTSFHIQFFSHSPDTFLPTVVFTPHSKNYKSCTKKDTSRVSNTFPQNRTQN